jgi:hypothetical protein
MSVCFFLSARQVGKNSLFNNLKRKRTKLDRQETDESRIGSIELRREKRGRRRDRATSRIGGRGYSKYIDISDIWALSFETPVANEIRPAQSGGTQTISI